MVNSPNPASVRFDHGVAADASRTLRQLAAEIEGQATRRAGLAAAARQSWRGAHESEFDAEHRRHQRTASELAADLRRAAGQIDVAAARRPA